MKWTKEYKKEYNRAWYLKNQKERNRKSLEYYHNNKEHCRKIHKKYYFEHKEEKKEYFKEWLLKNPEYMKKYNVENRETLNKKRREFFSIKENRERKNKKRREFYSIEENRERKIKRNHRWYVKNKDHINQNTKLRRASDPNFKMKDCLRHRIREVLKGRSKSASTMKLLGCTIDELWVHLEAKFEPWMTRENHGLWHLDHIKPCFKFDLTDPAQQRECFHYSNLQPLEARENMKKGHRYEVEQAI